MDKLPEREIWLVVHSVVKSIPAIRVVAEGLGREFSASGNESPDAHLVA